MKDEVKTIKGIVKKIKEITPFVTKTGKTMQTCGILVGDTWVNIREFKLETVQQKLMAVLEGDEYPTSGIDKKSKFLHLPVRDVVLISAGHDHVNIFPDEESYLKPFQELLSRVPDDGKIIACTDNQNVKELINPF